MNAFNGASDNSIVVPFDVPRTAALRRLIESQTNINRFFWSSELSYQICLQRVLRPLAPIQQDDSVASIFADVRANALLPPNNKKRVSHFAGSVGDFEQQLRVNLRSVCEHVILDFFGDFELFLEERLTPFLIERASTMKDRLDRIDPTTDKRFINTWAKRKLNGLLELLKSGPFIVLVEMLKGLEIIDAASADSVNAEVLLRAEGFRFLRHKLTHPESHTYGDEQRVEGGLRERILSDKRFQKLPDLIGKSSNAASVGTGVGSDTLNASQNFIIHSVFDDPESRKRKGHADNPLIFYQAIFALGAFNRLSTALDGALPLPPHLRAAANTQCDDSPGAA